MTGFTTDPNDKNLKHGSDTTPTPQSPIYLILSEEERAKGFVRPVRDTYRHTCGHTTRMHLNFAETYARNPKFYGSTYCCFCGKHLPVTEFKWLDGQVVGS